MTNSSALPPIPLLDEVSLEDSPTQPQAPKKPAVWLAPRKQKKVQRSAASRRSHSQSPRGPSDAAREERPLRLRLDFASGSRALAPDHLSTPRGGNDASSSSSSLLLLGSATVLTRPIALKPRPGLPGGTVPSIVGVVRAPAPPMPMPPMMEWCANDASYATPTATRGD